MAEPLKTQFGRDVPQRLAAEIAGEYPTFDAAGFLRDALEGFDALELLDRGRHLGRVLHQYLPAAFPEAVDVILRTLPATREPAGGMASFYYLPHTEFVRAFGVAHFDDSMRALHALTQCFTAEFAIRPFLEHHRDATLARLAVWARDPSEHVRRLVSEGTRPRLPCAPRLREFQRDPTPVIALLQMLRDDPALYVRRSVANNLNDIYKDHPARVVTLSEEWLHAAPAPRRWVIQHALRSAVKRGDPAALSALGFHVASTLVMTDAQITPAQPVMGGRVTVLTTLQNPTPHAQRVVVDLVVHFVKHHGGATAKVFKLQTVELAAGEQVALRKTVSLADLTTRRHYPGVHRVELQCNGVTQPLGTFTLRARA